MLGRRLLVLGLALASLTGPALAAKTPAKPKAAVTNDKQLAARREALLAFQKDLVSVIAPQAMPLPLLGGALLARPLSGQPDFNSFHSLIERAASLRKRERRRGIAVIGPTHVIDDALLRAADRCKLAGVGIVGGLMDTDKGGGIVRLADSLGLSICEAGAPSCV